MNYNFEYRKCPLCENKNTFNSLEKLFDFEHFENNERYSVSECKNCGFIHQNPSWNQDFYNDLYKFFYYPLDQELPSGYKKRCEIICNTINTLHKKNKKLKILDFGCNNGSFVNYAKNDNLINVSKIIGYDIQLRDIDEEDGFYNSLNSLCKNEGKFDVIILNFVLEHILDPVGFLSMFYEKLIKKSGYLIVEVPDQSFINSLDFHPFHIQHTNYFTPATIALTFSKARFSTYQIKTYNNYNLGRDPNTPSLIAVARKNEDFCWNGKMLKANVENNRTKMIQKIKEIGKNPRIGIVGCGDAIHPLIKYSKINIENIVVLFDNNQKLHGRIMYDKTILPLEKIDKLDLDAIIISTLFVPSILALRKQISEFYDLKKVISFEK